MESVKVSRVRLIEKIDANRQKHVDAYQAALVGWRKKLVDAYAKALKIARAQKEPRPVHLPKPQSYMSHYDRVLGMLRMSTDQVVELTAEDYDRYIRDEWEWSGVFSASNAAYTRVAKKARR